MCKFRRRNDEEKTRDLGILETGSSQRHVGHVLELRYRHCKKVESISAARKCCALTWWMCFAVIKAWGCIGYLLANLFNIHLLSIILLI